MRAVPDQIRPWVPGALSLSLGTDGFGLSDTRGALRRHFNVDAESITVATLEALGRQGVVDAALAKQAQDKYQLLDVTRRRPGPVDGRGLTAPRGEVRGQASRPCISHTSTSAGPSTALTR